MPVRILAIPIYLIMAAGVSSSAQPPSPGGELPVRDSSVIEVIPPIPSSDRMGEMPVRMIWESPLSVGVPSLRNTPYEWMPSAVSAAKVGITRNKYSSFSPGYAGNPGRIYITPDGMEKLNKVEIARRSWWPYTFMD